MSSDKINCVYIMYAVCNIMIIIVSIRIQRIGIQTIVVIRAQTRRPNYTFLSSVRTFWANISLRFRPGNYYYHRRGTRTPPKLSNWYCGTPSMNGKPEVQSVKPARGSAPAAKWPNLLTVQRNCCVFNRRSGRKDDRHTSHLTCRPRSDDRRYN